MQLSEIIEKNGVMNISQRTNISIDNLEKLNKGEFEKLNRVKSLGFLKILEREYEADVEELRTTIKEYFKAHHTVHDDEVVMLTKSQEADVSSSSGFFKWLIIFGILYGLWSLYSHGKLDSFFSVESKINILDDTTALESSVSDADAKKVVLSESNDSQKKIEVKIETDKIVPEKALETTESNKIGEIGSVVNQNISQTIESVQPILVNGDENSTLIDTAEKRVDEEDQAQIIYNLTVNPTKGMLWYGFINLDTKERREFMNKKSTPFELDGNRWILVTGHGYVDIVSDAKTINISDRKKHYFYLDSTEIREIDRKEFRSLNNGKGW